jgi:hypothetical protein
MDEFVYHSHPTSGMPFSVATDRYAFAGIVIVPVFLTTIVNLTFWPTLLLTGLLQLNDMDALIPPGHFLQAMIFLLL